MILRTHTLLLLTLALLFLPFAAADDSTRTLYSSTCQGCHGPAGHGTAIGKKMGAKDYQDAEVKKMTIPALIEVISNGRTRMPAYKGQFTDTQIKGLAKYIKELQQKPADSQ